MNLEKFIEKNAPRNRIALLVIIDIFLITLSGFLALYIRYDFRFSQMDMRYVDYEILYLPVNLVVTLLLFVLFKLYRSVWRFASSTELLNVIGACSGSIILQIIGMGILEMRMPVSYYHPLPASPKRWRRPWPPFRPSSPPAWRRSWRRTRPPGRW